MPIAIHDGAQLHREREGAGPALVLGAGLGGARAPGRCAVHLAASPPPYWINANAEHLAATQKQSAAAHLTG